MVRSPFGPYNILLLATTAVACSNFLMDNKYMLSVRTVDTPVTALGYGIITSPKGATLSHNNVTAKYGFVAIATKEAGIVVEGILSGGLNEAGLSCDVQSLDGTKYPNRTHTAADVGVDYLCQYVLGTYSNTSQVFSALADGTLNPHGPSVAGGDHFVFRDLAGKSVVAEFLNGQVTLTVDLNDGGATGFGIMTNQPRIEWQIENVRHFLWKDSNARPAVSVPGSFYPDDRFLRIYLMKSAMPDPSSHKEAMIQAVHVMNSITVPMGDQIGTDKPNDVTVVGAVYDHANLTVYWRTHFNQNLQRLRLQDAKLEVGSQGNFVEFGHNKLPWFSDAAGAMEPY